KVLDQDFDGDRLAHLFREPRAALVVAQRAEALAQGGSDAVPAVEGASHLVQQHDRRPVSGKLEVDANAVGVDPGHGRPPGFATGIEAWALAKFNTGGRG